MCGVQALRRDRTKASDATRVWGANRLRSGQACPPMRPHRREALPPRASPQEAQTQPRSAIEHLGNGLAPVLGKRTLVAYPPIELSKSSEMTSAPNST